MPQRNPRIARHPIAEGRATSLSNALLQSSSADRLGPRSCARSCFVSLGAFQIEIEASKFHVGGLGDFDVALRAVHDMNVVAQAFDDASFVGGADLIGEGFGQGFLE